jgi:teichuronic acid biosynthesis glycosyltransferase TuaC
MREYRRALRDAARVVAVSEALARDVARIADVEAQVIPIGVDLTRFTRPIDRRRARRALGLGSDEFAIVVAAYLEPRKRIREIADAVHALGEPFRVVFAGAGPELGYRALRGRVDYLGPVDNEAVPDLLAAADVTVLPSDREGLPTALVEAGAAGVPIIASRAGGIPELLADGRGLLLDDTSASGIMAGLRAVEADRHQARDRGQRLRSHVLAEYDADDGARRLRLMYSEVLEEHGRGHRLP